MRRSRRVVKRNSDTLYLYTQLGIELMQAKRVISSLVVATRGDAKVNRILRDIANSIADAELSRVRHLARLL